MSKHNSKKVSYDLDTKFISAALKLKAAPNKSDEGDFVKSFEKAGNFADKINVIGKFSIGRTDLYSVVLDINKDIKADLEDKDNMKRLLQALYVSALIKFAFVPKVHEGELTKYIPLEFQILERQIHQLISSVIDSKKEVEVEEVDVAPEEEIGAEKETESGFSKAFGAVKETVKKAKADKPVEGKKEEPKETKTESKPKEEVNVNPVQPAVEDEKAQRPADQNNTFYATLKQLEAVALQREAQWYATSSPEDSNSAREYAYQQYAQQFNTDPICIPEYRAYLANFLTPEESAMFFADVQQPGFVNPQQPMGYQPVQQPVQAPQQPVAPAQTTVSEAVVQDVQPAQAPEQPVQVDAPQPATVDAPQATVSEVVAQDVQPQQAPVEVKEKLETSDHDLTECVAKYLGYSSYKHFMNTYLDANAMKRKAKINKLVDVDKVILNFTYLIRDAITKNADSVLGDAMLKGGRFRVSGIQWINNVPFVVLRNNKMVLEVNAIDYLKPGNIFAYRINEMGKDAWFWTRIQTGETQPLVFTQNQAQQSA